MSRLYIVTVTTHTEVRDSVPTLYIVATLTKGDIYGAPWGSGVDDECPLAYGLVRDVGTFDMTSRVTHSSTGYTIKE